MTRRHFGRPNAARGDLVFEFEPVTWVAADYRLGWFLGRRTWFTGIVEVVERRAVIVVGIDAFAEWEDDLLFVADRARLPSRADVEAGERVRWTATV